MKSIRKRFQDWMTVITYAEAGEPSMGMNLTGSRTAGKKEAVLEQKSAQAPAYEFVEQERPAVPPAACVKESKENLIVMVVDDEPIVGRRLKPALLKCGCEVEVFENPVEAMQRFNERDFDIVVTDLRMENLDGIRVLEHVKSRSEKTKVIFITGYATVENAREALVKGAFDFIAKPFKISDLRLAIQKAALSMGLQIPSTALG
jgi:CheY-like chemotaxis protein